MAELQGEDRSPFNFRFSNKDSYSVGRHSTIKELRRNPDFIVKRVDYIQDEKSWEHESNMELADALELKVPLSPSMTFSRFKATVLAESALINNPQLGFAPFIPKNYPVYGEGPNGQEKGYIVMEKVWGETLTKRAAAAGLQVKNLEEFGEFIVKALDFYDLTASQSSDGLGYLPDFIQAPQDGPAFFKNLIIGHTKSHPEPDRLYLVDTYPLLRVHIDNACDMALSIKEALLVDFEPHILGCYDEAEEGKGSLDGEVGEDFAQYCRENDDLNKIIFRKWWTFQGEKMQQAIKDTDEKLRGEYLADETRKQKLLKSIYLRKKYWEPIKEKIMQRLDVYIKNS